jgi:hypothetical protein
MRSKEWREGGVRENLPEEILEEMDDMGMSRVGGDGLAQ